MTLATVYGTSFVMSSILIRHWPIRRRENCGRGCDLDVICFTEAAQPVEWKPVYIRMYIEPCICMNTCAHTHMYTNTIYRGNFHGFHGFSIIANHFLWIMALSIGIISLQICYNESFIVNSERPFSTQNAKVFLHGSFLVYGRHIYKWMHTRMHTYAHKHIHTHTRAHTCTYKHTHTRTHMHTHTHTHTHTYKT